MSDGKIGVNGYSMTVTPLMWISVVVGIVLIAVVFCFVLYKLLKGKNIETKLFTATQKTQIQAESRELSDNQMRAAKILIGQIGMQYTDNCTKMYPQMSEMEADYIDLLAKFITDNLLNQFRIDLVRNHITKKTDEELKLYSLSKSEMYRTKARMLISEYNRNIHGFDLREAWDYIEKKDMDDIYLQAYTQARTLSIGY